MTESELKNKRALVTGAGRGIGSIISKAFAAAGAHVGLAARTTDQLRSVADQIAADGGEASVFSTDICHEDQVCRAVDSFVDRYGGIDILVNNAGITGPIGPTYELDVNQWELTVRVNLLGCCICTRHVLPHMISQHSGKIINLSGGGAVGPRPRFGAYSASKAAVVRFTETVAAEVAEFGIDVNAIAPGAINTAMLEDVIAAGNAAGSEAERARQQKKAGGDDPQKAARLAVFLASSRSDGLSGRLLSALWDDWEHMDIKAVMASDTFAVRRIKPDSTS